MKSRKSTRRISSIVAKRKSLFGIATSDRSRRLRFEALEDRRMLAGKVVAFFITPTTSTAPEYRIEVVSMKPKGFGVPEFRAGEPSVVEDFKAALGAR